MSRLFAAAAAALLAASAASAQDAAAGRELASQQCAACHGVDGVARLPNAPNIGGESAIYLVEQLKAFKSGRRQHEIMSIVAAGLDDAQIGDLAAWYSSIAFTVTVPD